LQEIENVDTSSGVGQIAYSSDVITGRSVQGHLRARIRPTMNTLLGLTAI